MTLSAGVIGAQKAIIAANDWVGAQTGWRGYMLCLVAGAAAAGGLAPYYIWPLLFVGFVILVWRLDRIAYQKKKFATAFATGWWFAFGYLSLSLYWMALSFVVHASSFWSSLLLGGAGFVSILALAGGIALFYGAAMLLAISAWIIVWQRVLLFSACWSLAEIARSYLFTGLPWNLTGHALAGSALTAQLVAYIGPYGLSLLTIALSAFLALLVTADRRVTWWPAAVFVLSGLALVVAGGTRILLLQPGFHDDISIRIIQPNIQQKDKINPSYHVQNFRKLADMSPPAAVDDGPGLRTRFTLWPENAAYGFFQEEPAARDYVAHNMRMQDILVTGAIRGEQGGDVRRQKYFNALLVLQLAGRNKDVPVWGPPLPGQVSQLVISHQYDKHHLAPFGEYLPFAGFWDALGLAALTPVGNGFTAGAGPKTLHIGQTKVAPIICYETIFSGQIYPRELRPDWLLTVTNDAWFGDSAGPRQHMDQSRLRSIETGLPMARAANTGVSAIIDAKGQVLTHIPLYQTGVIEYDLPESLPPTLYAVAGQWPYVIILCVFLGIFLLRRRQQKV